MFHDTLKLSVLTKLDVAYHTMPWQAPDLDRLVSSCSHLQKLSLCCSPGLQLTPLLQLTALTSLWLAGVTADSTVTSLVQLSALQGLRVLTVMNTCRFTDDAVRSLTALTQLTRLRLSDREGVFSTTMHQQLLQHFSQEELDERTCTCHIINNTVGSSWPAVMLVQCSDLAGATCDMLCQTMPCQILQLIIKRHGMHQAFFQP